MPEGFRAAPQSILQALVQFFKERFFPRTTREVRRDTNPFASPCDDYRFDRDNERTQRTGPCDKGSKLPRGLRQNSRSLARSCGLVMTNQESFISRNAGPSASLGMTTENT